MERRWSQQTRANLLRLRVTGIALIWRCLVGHVGVLENPSLRHDA